MPRTLSISMPTHNRADIMLRTIESLRGMEIPPGVSIELIVIANACTDRTADAVREIAPRMPFPTRCVEEPAAGLAHARNRAIQEAAGEVIAFLDDDLWVSPAWLANLLAVLENYPADIVSGRTILWWEAVPRPGWMAQRAEHLLSCTDYGDQVIELKFPGLAIGANFAVRRELFQRLGPFANLGRTPLIPLGGEDTEFFARALDAGCRMFYAPSVEVKHWVAPHRITLNYLTTVAYSNGLVRSYLRKRLSGDQAAWIIIKYALRWLAYCALELLARLFFQRKMRVNHRIRRMTCLGIVVGTFRRFRGLSPVGAPLTPALSSEPH